MGMQALIRGLPIMIAPSIMDEAASPCAATRRISQIGLKVRVCTMRDFLSNLERVASDLVFHVSFREGPPENLVADRVLKISMA